LDSAVAIFNSFLLFFPLFFLLKTPQVVLLVYKEKLNNNIKKGKNEEMPKSPPLALRPIIPSPFPFFF
jgi:hypothetical protein